MAFLTGLFNVLLVLCSFFLICLVLIQRGKGGGLAGAFGGVGGSSAFGTKAGDVFTKVTIITAIIWFVLNLGLVILTNQRPVSAFETPKSSSSKEVPVSDSKGKGKSTTPSSSKSTEKETTPATSSSKDKDLLPPVFEEPAKPSNSTPPAGDATKKKGS